MNAEAQLKWLGRASAVLMLGVLGWLGANIYWRVSAPENVLPSLALETDAQRAQQMIAGRHLFGVHVVANTGNAAVPSDIKLNGAIAADKPGQRAYALLSIEGKPTQLVREGEDIAPGITLQRVEARQVSILRSGQPITLRLPETGKAAEPNKAAGILPAPIAEAQSTTTPNTAPPPSVGQPPQVTPPTQPTAPAKATPPPAQTTPAAPPEPATPTRRRTRRSSTDDT